MRRIVGLLSLAFFVLFSAGCVISLDVRDRPSRRQVVEIDGKLYVVDVRTSRVREIDLDTATEIESTTETEIETTDD